MKTVLYISRDTGKIKRVRELLKKAGFKLLAVFSGEKAFKLLKKSLPQSRPSFVIYDVRVILKEGAKNFLRLKSEFPALPVVAASPIYKKAGRLPHLPWSIPANL